MGTLNTVDNKSVLKMFTSKWKLFSLSMGFLSGNIRAGMYFRMIFITLAGRVR